MTAPVFARESYEAVVEEIKPLLVKHWEEIALNRDLIKLNPNYQIYENLDKMGLLRIYTVRLDGVLVGYAIYALSRNPHYWDTRWARNDIYWIDPAHRNAGVGIGLFRFCEDNLRGELAPGEILVMHTNSKTMHPQAHRVLEFLGHEMIEVGHSKLLQGG